MANGQQRMNASPRCIDPHTHMHTHDPINCTLEKMHENAKGGVAYKASDIERD